ncbi:class I SAM-dependent methyltransferase [Actinokineospora sp. NBRC 105648]|uniref:class I SAM-dependent methyltransferase n=1 Tax=Actinokineospora sp. NBRC 105648 TaxID=3032206 RepID=UPI0024A13E38|nr:class I SAM-dependent methyltransferase [Actinokineospora sp. NBRC 105648]GLZ40111.1 methyltransferase [Actinokineospora sp. NBRC 105648]
MTSSAEGARLGFNHNDFYHRHLLRQVPPDCGRALDIGCGTGGFARLLARRARSVEAIDRDPEVVRAAEALSGGVANLNFTSADLAEYQVDDGAYDFISCLASLHHMPFVETVTRLRAALAPGGVLAVLGCHRPATAADYLPDVVAIPTNLLANAAVRLRSRIGGDTGLVDSAPVAAPTMTIAEIRAAAARVLPGAVIRRRLYWRHTLLYTKRS